MFLLRKKVGPSPLLLPLVVAVETYWESREGQAEISFRGLSESPSCSSVCVCVCVCVCVYKGASVKLTAEELDKRHMTSSAAARLTKAVRDDPEREEAVELSPQLDQLVDILQ